MKRRSFLRMSATGALVLGVAENSLAASKTPTPAEIEGPFYPVLPQQDKDLDLTQIQGRSQKAKGQHIEILGQVIDTGGQVVQEATVDIWQANAAGRYNHPHDSNPAPLDSNFQGWGIVKTDQQGDFSSRQSCPVLIQRARVGVDLPTFTLK